MPQNFYSAVMRWKSSLRIVSSNIGAFTKSQIEDNSQAIFFLGRGEVVGTGKVCFCNAKKRIGDKRTLVDCILCSLSGFV